MRKLKLLTHCTLLVTSPSLVASPQNTSITMPCQDKTEWVSPTSYDEIMQMLEDLESGELERRYSPMQLERLNDFLAMLAKEGVLPNEEDQEADLKEDTYNLKYGENSAFQLICYLETSHEYAVVPAIFHGYSGYSVIQCGKISNAWKKTKKFAKKHKKQIIIGAVVVVAVAVVAGAVVAASSAGAMSAAGASTSGKASLPPPRENDPVESSSNEIPVFKSTMEQEVNSFKESLAQENFFQPPAPGENLTWEETGRVLGPILAHDSFNHLANNPQVFQELQSIASLRNFSLPSEAKGDSMNVGHYEIDKKFGSNSGLLFSDSGKEVNLSALLYQQRGEAAHSHMYYGQAVKDFSKAITLNPMNPTPYLQRSASYFDMGQYEKSVSDFHQYNAHVENIIPFSSPEFALGFAKGLPIGIYESGKGIMLFLGDLVTHPIHTAEQMYVAISTLAKLARDDQWGVIGEVLSPEIHQLVKQWDTLPSVTRGELAGHAFGKHGADILTPGALVKIASKSAKSARAVAAIINNLQKAEKTLVLETAAGCGNTARVGEIINSGRKTVFLGDELGFTAKEMGQLKQTGKLETTVTEAYEHLSLSMQESVALFKKAEAALKPYAKRPMPEVKVRELIHQTGLPTFPRPKGIPKNYVVMISEKGVGMEYVHPTNTHYRIRVMPGKPHSPNVGQQKPYVIQKIDRGALDKTGKYVSTDSPQAHIPLKDFVYRS